MVDGTDGDGVGIGVGADDVGRKAHQEDLFQVLKRQRML